MENIFSSGAIVNIIPLLRSSHSRFLVCMYFLMMGIERKGAGRLEKDTTRKNKEKLGREEKRKGKEKGALTGVKRPGEGSLRYQKTQESFGRGHSHQY